VDTGTAGTMTAKRSTARRPAVPENPPKRPARRSAPLAEGEVDRNHLIESHVALVEHVVLRLSAGFPRHVDRSELVSAGMVGLVEAAERFDPARGIPFSRFAATRIRGAMLDSVRTADWAPRSVRAMARDYEAAEQSLASKLGRTPVLAEVADAVGISTAELEQLREQVNRGVVMTLDHAYGDDATIPLVATIIDPSSPEPDLVIESTERTAYLHDAVTALPERHRCVIQGYFLDGKTSQEIADELGITQSRVSQLRADALEMMREGLEAQYTPKDPERPVGRVARRKSRYASAIARQSSWKARVTLTSGVAVQAEEATYVAEA
jgi:RNA polymerase sigma factor for flagellar operon FliA